MDDENVIVCDSAELKNKFYAIKHNNTIYWGDYSQKVIRDGKMYIKIQNLYSVEKKIIIFLIFNCELYSVYK